MSETSIMLRHDPIDCIGPNFGGQSKASFQEIHIQSVSLDFRSIQDCKDENSARVQVEAV